MTLAEAQLAAQEYRFAIARAELGQQVRSLFAFGIAVRDNLALARENEERARELSRIARELVESGTGPSRYRGIRRSGCRFALAAVGDGAMLLAIGASSLRWLHAQVEAFLARLPDRHVADPHSGRA